MVVVFVVAWVLLQQSGYKFKMGAGIYGAVGAGCRLWGLLPSWFRKVWSEAAEVAVTARWRFISNAGFTDF